MIPTSQRNISRIRLEAFGRSASEVERHLHEAASQVYTWEGESPLGEVVIERDSSEPDGSRHAFRGRAIVHPNVAPLETEGIPTQKVMILTEFSSDDPAKAEELVQDSYRHYETVHLVTAAKTWEDLPHATQLIHDGESLASVLRQVDADR